jgi:hypothetical protein
VIGLVALVARRRGVPSIGPGFAVGYLSHLLGDIIYHVVTHVLRGEAVPLAGVVFPLWPLITQPVRESPGLIGQTSRLFVEFGAYLASPVGTVYLALELGLLAIAFGTWLVDGRPGVRSSR